MKKSSVLIPLPSLIKNSFVRSIAKVCDYTSGAKDAHPGGTGKKLW